MTTIHQRRHATTSPPDTRSSLDDVHCGGGGGGGGSSGCGDCDTTNCCDERGVMWGGSSEQRSDHHNHKKKGQSSLISNRRRQRHGAAKKQSCHLIRMAWIARITIMSWMVGIILGGWGVGRLYRYRLQVEQQQQQQQQQEDKSQMHLRPALAIHNHVLEPMKFRWKKVMDLVKEHLRKSTVSELAQDQIIHIFNKVSMDDQKKVLQVLKNVIQDGVLPDKEEQEEEERKTRKNDPDGQENQEIQRVGGKHGLHLQENERPAVLRRHKVVEDQTLRVEKDDEKEEKKKKEMEQELYQKFILQPLSTHVYADRHIQKFLDIVHSKVCQNPVVDLSDPQYQVQHAVDIFEECRIVIFQNAFDIAMLQEYREKFADFIHGLVDGSISKTGSNTGGDSIFLAERGRGRYEIVLPERLLEPAIVAHQQILQVIQHWKLLGQNSALRSLQSLLSEGNHGGGTPAQPWHYDQGFLFGLERGGLDNYGLAGHDLPPAAISLAVPLLDFDRSLGPTEFCLGSSALNGVDPHAQVLNATLTEKGSLFQKYFEHDGLSCPAECWLAPLLQMGDAVLWDYGVRHRGGWNSSPYLRSILLLIYSKRWYDDINFGDKIRKHPFQNEDPDLTQLLSRTRLALPDHDIVNDNDDNNNNDDDDDDEEEDNDNDETSGDQDDSEHVKKRKTNKQQKEKKEEKKNNKKKQRVTRLQDITHIYPNTKYSWEKKHEMQDFIVTNYNVPGNPTLYRNGVPSGGYLPVGASKTIKGAYGDWIELRLLSGGDQKVVGRFQCSNDGQFVFTNDAVTTG